MHDKHIVVGLAGNPNVGKSAIFNTLTGGRQHVGNWPGKTSERDVVDATCLERNLNLTLQSQELTDKIVIALNLMDEVQRQGWETDVKALEATLGVPVIPTVAVEGKGLPELVDAIIAMAQGRRTEPTAVDYGMTIEGYVQNLEADLDSLAIDGQSRWLALRLLEDDPEIVQAFKEGNLSHCCLAIWSSVLPIDSPCTTSVEGRSTVVEADRLELAWFCGAQYQPTLR